MLITFAPVDLLLRYSVLFTVESLSLLNAGQVGLGSKIVIMIRKYHNHKPQTTPCLLLLPLWESVIVLCFVVRYFMSILVLQSS